MVCLSCRGKKSSTCPIASFHSPYGISCISVGREKHIDHTHLHTSPRVNTVCVYSLLFCAGCNRKSDMFSYLSYHNQIHAIAALPGKCICRVRRTSRYHIQMINCDAICWFILQVVISRYSSRLKTSKLVFMQMAKQIKLRHKLWVHIKRRFSAATWDNTECLWFILCEA